MSQSIQVNGHTQKTAGEEKILLLLLPFWASYIPPMGISCLKPVLRQHGYTVKTVDVNIEQQFRAEYDRYFQVLEKIIPPRKQGNLYNIGNDVLRNHLMIHLNNGHEEGSEDFVRALILKNLYFEVEPGELQELNEIVTAFYLKLERYLTRLFQKEKPTVVGISVFNGTLPASLFAFQLAKEIAPSIKTVMGGGIFADDLALGSPNLEYFLEKTPYIDKIIIGEGEILFPGYLRGGLPDSQRVYTLKDIENRIMDISKAPVPDFSDFDLTYYPHSAAYASRSCPFHCSFCSETVRWGKYRKKEAPRIVREMKGIYETYGYQLFLMCDSLLNPVITGLAKEFIRSDISLYWDGYLRVGEEVCSTDNTLLWRRGGFYRARLGVESGSRAVLNLMGKKITTEQIASSVSSLARAGIKTTTYWVIGHPGETEEDFRQTLDIIERLADDIYEADCNPFNYYIGGQVNSEKWQKKNNVLPLYPEIPKEKLLLPTWVLQAEPSRDETYDRLNRFVEHCRRLGIPNPYSMHEIYKADERWKSLHRNAVPPLVELKKRGTCISESKQVKKLESGNKVEFHDDNWGF
jgi:radical SAM superfamily enzyme YgiQ (UPF0313 family)